MTAPASILAAIGPGVIATNVATRLAVRYGVRAERQPRESVARPLNAVD